MLENIIENGPQIAPQRVKFLWLTRAESFSHWEQEVEATESFLRGWGEQALCAYSVMNW